MKIRPVVNSDINQLAALAQKTYAETFGAWLSNEELSAELLERRSAEAFKQDILNGDDILLGLEDDTIIGYVQFGDVKIPELSQEPDSQELQRLYVRSDYQGRGYGQDLLLAALATPRMKAANTIYLDVWDQNDKALGLYKKHGFVGSGRTDVRVGNTVIDTDLVMKRTKPTT